MDDIDLDGGLDEDFDTGADDALVEPGAVLLLDDLPDGVDGHYCGVSLAAGPAEDRAEIQVRSPDDQLDRVGIGASSRQPAKRGVIAVGDVMEAAAASDPDYSEPVVFDAVRDPGDLRSLATAISRACEAWAAGDYRITCCFDSVSDLLEHADTEDVFKFVHVLSKRFEAIDAVAHFHVDPNAHDEQVIRTLENVVDEVFVEFEADDRALDVTTSSRRTSDDDVAAAVGEGSSESAGTNTGGGEATDDDIEDAIEDI